MQITSQQVQTLEFSKILNEAIINPCEPALACQFSIKQEYSQLDHKLKQKELQQLTLDLIKQ